MPQTEFQFDLVLHIHNEGESLNELRCSIRASSSQVLEVWPGKPIGEPKTNIEPAVGLTLDALKHFSLFFSAQVILHPHSGELQAEDHLSEGPLEEIVDSSQEDDDRTVLTASRSYVILELSSNTSIALAFLRQL